MISRRYLSAVPGIHWPAVGGIGGNRLLALLFQLQESQWWDPRTLRRRQLEQAAALLRHARDNVPYYRERLDAGLVPGEADALGYEDWCRLPILRREDVQAAGEDIDARRLPPGHGRKARVQTSGSTGRPVRAFHTELSSLIVSAVNLRGHYWYGRDFTRKLGVIRDFKGNVAPYPNGIVSKRWSRSVASIAETGPSVALNIDLSTVDQQIEWLGRHDPDYLLIFPTVLREMARRCLERGISFPALRQVGTIGEVVTAEIRDLCRQAFGVPLFDTYSTQEVGTIALQCPEHPHYHVQAESILLEILDEEDRPVPPGAVGRVVVTNLHNLATPLIRYEVGDYAEAGEGGCSCGRGLPVVARFVGRTRNLLVLPDGQRKEPGFDAATFTEVAPIRQFQVIQTSPTGITVRLVVQERLDGDAEARLADRLRRRFGYPFAFAFEYVDEIPRAAGGKFEDFKVAFEV